MSATRREDAPQVIALIDAAAAVLEREGIERITIRRIAAEAGVPLGKVHYWFASKEDLVERLALRHIGEMGRLVEAAIDKRRPAAPRTAYEDSRALFSAALRAEAKMARGARIAPRELIAWALRTGGREGLAAEISRAHRQATAPIVRAWLQRHDPDGRVDAEIAITAVAVFYEGLAQALVADPDGIEAAKVSDLFARMLAGLVDPASIPPASAKVSPRRGPAAGSRKSSRSA